MQKRNQAAFRRKQWQVEAFVCIDRHLQDTKYLYASYPMSQASSDRERCFLWYHLEHTS
ncbi:hypothetical protein D3C87_2057520 [compost metagenome]